MTEPELLQKLSKLESDSQVLEIKIKIWKDEAGKADLIKRNEAVKVEIAELKRQLDSPNDTGNENPEETKNEEEINFEMTELEILRDLSRLESDSGVMEIKIKVLKDGQDKTNLIEKNEAIKAESQKLRKKLDSLNDRKYGEEVKLAIIRQLREHISIMDSTDHEMTQQDLFEKIYSGLYVFVSDKATAKPTHPMNDDRPVDLGALTDFLNQELEIVTHIKVPTYVNLRQYLAEMKDRILKNFPEGKTR